MHVMTTRHVCNENNEDKAHSLTRSDKHNDDEWSLFIDEFVLISPVKREA